MIIVRNIFCVALLALPCAGQGLAAESDTPVGRRVEDFSLRDYRGRQHSLSDYKQAKVVVVAFLGTECPLAKLYGPRLEALAKKYAAHDVQIVGVNSNSQDSITELAAYARIHELSFPLLKDVGNQVADQLGAVRTPEAFVLDQQRVVRYWGRIDDQYGVGYTRDEPKRQDVAIAIDDLLAGKPVSVPQTESVGCHIGRVLDPDADSPVTYSNQIARILQRRCVECHRDGDIAPFALTDYDEVAGWAEMIREVVDQQRMPPWHANPQYGHFANDRHLSDDEKQLIFQWVRTGAPQGDPADLPEPRQFTAGWQLPQQPDLVIDMRDQPFTVPAEGTVRYQYFSVDPGFTEDKWVKMAEVLPGNRAVVHHILVFVRPPGGLLRSRGITGDFLVGYVPGLRARPLPDGMAKLIPAGSKLVFQMHYTPIGSQQQDLSKVGLVFTDPDKVTRQVLTTKAVQHRLEIPPHDDNYRAEATSGAHGGDVLLLSMMPHAHLRGKSFRYEAVYPDGKSEVLLDVPHYDFNWQTSYRLAEPQRMPAGTRIHVVAHYDNSEDNLANPDPTATIRWGDQTWNEMMIGYFDIAIPRDPQAAVAGAKPAPSVPRIGVAVVAKRLIDRHDANHDGQVDREEMPQQYKARFDRLDKNGDGGITADELAESLQER